MKKTNKKGFTLVELLAVIVILGVLLLIAVPSIQNVIKSSKRRSFESAIKLALENVETLASTGKVTGTVEPCYVEFGDKDVKFEDNRDRVLKNEISLERGSYGKGTFGIITVNKDGKGTAYVNGENGTYYIVGKDLKDLSTSTPDDSSKDSYKSIDALINAFAPKVKNSDNTETAVKCSLQSWWEE